jgi:RNA polymerase sigma-70 factor (ECF subfamily)
MSNATDPVLIDEILRGDEFAFAELLGRYRTSVWRTVRRRLGNYSESEDAMQEIFLRAYTSLHRFDANRPFEHWIMRIATNYCIDVLRQRRLRPPWLCSEYEDSSAACVNDYPQEPSPWAPEEMARTARRVLAALRPHNRDAFVLRELEGLKYSEVGRALRISPLAARVRVSRARKELHRRLRVHLPLPNPSCRTPA